MSEWPRTAAKNAITRDILDDPEKYVDLAVDWALSEKYFETRP
jgi:hypothetical protein